MLVLSVVSATLPNLFGHIGWHSTSPSCGWHLLQADDVRTVSLQLLNQSWQPAAPLQVLQRAVGVPAADRVLVGEDVV